MNKRTLINFVLALGLALPASMAGFVGNAEAGPGSTLRSASKEGKRTHKRAGAKRTKKKKKSKQATRRSSTSRRSDSRTVRRTTTTHRSPRRTTRRTTRTRTVRTSPRRTTRTRTVRTSPRRTHHRTRTRTRTTHHHHHSSTRSSSRTTSASATRSGGSSIEAYLTGGLGFSGFASPAISDDALPGAGYNVALGIKGKYLGFELGFNGSGHTFDPEAATTDLAVIGLSGDLKLQPSFGFFEPYALAGLGGYSLQDGVIDEATGGAALRLGLGADLRFDDAAIGVRYLHSSYAFADDSGIYGGDFGATSETLGVNLSFYF